MSFALIELALSSLSSPLTVHRIMVTYCTLLNDWKDLKCVHIFFHEVHYHMIMWFSHALHLVRLMERCLMVLLKIKSKQRRSSGWQWPEEGLQALWCRGTGTPTWTHPHGHTHCSEVSDSMPLPVEGYRRYTNINVPYSHLPYSTIHYCSSLEK